MTKDPLEPDEFLRALVDNVPGEEDELRIRKGLVSKGMAGLTLLSADAAHAAVHGSVSGAAQLAAKGSAAAAATGGALGPTTTSAVAGGVAASSGALASAGAAVSATGAVKVFVASIVMASGVTAAFQLGESNEKQKSNAEMLVPVSGAHSSASTERALGPRSAEHASVGEAKAAARAEQGARHDEDGSSQGEGKENAPDGSRVSVPLVNEGSKTLTEGTWEDAPRDAVTESDGGPRAARETARDSLLVEEAAVLRRALEALRKEDWVGAERALQNHAARFPEGLLLIERKRMQARLERERAE